MDETPTRRIVRFDVDLEHRSCPPGTLAACVLTAPDDHPLWDQFLVWVCALPGDVRECECPDRRHRDQTHAFVIDALHPDYPATPDGQGGWFPLAPHNLYVRLYRLTDEIAVWTFYKALVAIEMLHLPLDPRLSGGEALDTWRDVVFRIASVGREGRLGVTDHIPTVNQIRSN